MKFSLGNDEDLSLNTNNQILLNCHCKVLAVHLINHPNLTNSLQSLSHRRIVADLSICYRYFHGHCSLEIKNIIPDPARRVRTTRSSTHSHPFQVTLPNPRTLGHKSPFIPELLNNGTLCHPLFFQILQLIIFQIQPQQT